MSGFDTIGGVGKGLMIGTEFMNRRKMMDDQNAYRQQLVGMQQEKHGAAMEQYGLQKAEQDRVKLMGDVSTNIQNQYRDRTDFERAGLFVDTGMKAGLFNPQDLESAKKTHEGLLKLAGPEAYAAVLRGDLGPMNRLFDSAGYGKISVSEDGAMYEITPKDGSKPFSVDKNGLLQNHWLSLESDRQSRNAANKLAGNKASAEIEKIESEAERNKADSDLKRATAAGKSEFTVDDNGNLVPNPLFNGKGFDPVKFANDFAGAGKNFIPDGHEDTAGILLRGQSYFQNITENGMDANGAKLSKGQLASAIQDSIHLAMGKGEITPNIGRDGKLKLTAQVDGRTYLLNPDFSESEALAIPGKDGKPRYDQGKIGQMYLEALRNMAVSDPERFKPAWALANDNQAFSEAVQRIGPNSPGWETLQIANTLRRGAEYSRSIPDSPQERPKSPTEPKPSFANIFPGGLGLGIDRGIRKIANVPEPVSPIEQVKNSLQQPGGVVAPSLANEVLAMIEESPALEKQFTEDEIWALVTASGDSNKNRRAHGLVR